MADLAASEDVMEKQLVLEQRRNPLLLLSNEDWDTAMTILGGHARKPDVVIGEPSYLFRWHVVPRNRAANAYLHLQVRSDPDRPLHDHPWDNHSVILAGGYDEVMGQENFGSGVGTKYGQWEPLVTEVRPIRKGQTRWRPAAQPHRLILPEGIDYTLTLFSTGPKVRDWGFWCKDGWRPHEECVVFDERGHSIWNPAIPRELV